MMSEGRKRVTSILRITRLEQKVKRLEDLVEDIREELRLTDAIAEQDEKETKIVIGQLRQRIERLEARNG